MSDEHPNSDNHQKKHTLSLLWHTDLPGELNRFVESEQPVLIDLTGLCFIDPYGTIILYSLIRHLSKTRTVHIKVPEHQGVFNFFRAIELGQQLKKYDVEFDKKTITDNVKIRKERGFRIFWERSLSNDDEVEYIALEILQLARAKVALLRERENHDRFYETISELLSNVEVHSRVGQASIIVCTYNPKERRPYIGIAIGDHGVGIPFTLRGKFPELSDSELIERATCAGVKGSADTGGMGLYEVRDLVEEFRENLVIRSGGGVFRIRLKSKITVPDMKDSMLLPGTQIYFTISEPLRIRKPRLPSLFGC